MRARVTDMSYMAAMRPVCVLLKLKRRSNVEITEPSRPVTMKPREKKKYGHNDTCPHGTSNTDKDTN
jgi:hypothetical protein